MGHSFHTCPTDGCTTSPTILNEGSYRSRTADRIMENVLKVLSFLRPS